MAADAQERALPRRPHGLSRDDVARSQRQRILDAMTDAVAEKGYANTVVADVVTRSGVSRATFYEQFGGKDECFRAAYDAHAELVTRVMTGELEAVRHRPDVPPLEKLDRVLGVYLDALVAAPALARVFLVEVYAAGPALIAQRRATMDLFVDVVATTHDGEDGPLGTRPDQRFGAEFMVAAVSSLVTNIVGVGDVERLGELRPQLMQLAAQIIAP